MEIRTLMVEAQELVDNEVPLTLINIETRTEAQALLRNGWAAGTDYYLVQFLTGPYVGASVWLERQGNILVYEIRSRSDGFVFNYSQLDEEQDDETFVEGGAVITNLDGCGFWLK